MFKLNKFYSPDDSESIASDEPKSGPASDDKDDVIKFLSEEDEPDDEIKLEDKPKIKTKTEKAGDDEIDESDEKEEKDDELEELLEEIEEPKEEQLELVTPVRRREILSKYPTLFKDFPYLEKAYYREQQFTELFPTIPDAKEAVEKGKSFDTFERDLMSGNAENLFKVIKEGNPNSFNKIVDDLLPTLARVDSAAYTHLLGNTIRYTILNMLQEAKTNNNETLEAAAVILNQFAFGNSKFTPPSRLSKDEKPDEKSNQLVERERQFTKQQFDSATNDLNGRVNNAIMNAITGNIDPKSSMSDYVKKTAIREANESLASLMEKDARFKTIMDKLWEVSFKEGFSRPSLDRIKSAYLSRARTLLPSVIKKARNDALKGTGKRIKESDDSETQDRSKPRSQTKTSGNKEEKKIPRGMSTLEFLNQE